MVKYFAYSSLIHIMLAALIIVPAYFIGNNLQNRYYEVDFTGGIVHGGAPEAAKAAAAAPAVTQEDFLTKTKKHIEKLLPKSAVKPREAQTPAAQPQAAGTKAGAGQGDVGIAPGAGGTSGVNFPYTWYMRTLRERLLIHWNEIKNLGQDKSCTVVFTVVRDGSLSASGIEKSSSDTFFDRMALRAVSYAEPFPPLPDDFKENELKVHVEFKVAQ